MERGTDHTIDLSGAPLCTGHSQKGLPGHPSPTPGSPNNARLLMNLNPCPGRWVPSSALCTSQLGTTLWVIFSKFLEQYPWGPPGPQTPWSAHPMAVIECAPPLPLNWRGMGVPLPWPPRVRMSVGHTECTVPRNAQGDSREDTVTAVLPDDPGFSHLNKTGVWVTEAWGAAPRC